MSEGLWVARAPLEGYGAVERDACWGSASSVKDSHCIKAMASFEPSDHHQSILGSLHHLVRVGLLQLLLQLLLRSGASAFYLPLLVSIECFGLNKNRPELCRGP